MKNLIYSNKIARAGLISAVICGLLLFYMGKNLTNPATTFVRVGHVYSIKAKSICIALPTTKIGTCLKVVPKVYITADMRDITESEYGFIAVRVDYYLGKPIAYNTYYHYNQDGHVQPDDYDSDFTLVADLGSWKNNRKD